LHNIKTNRSELNDLNQQNLSLKKQMIQEYEQWRQKAGVVPKEGLNQKNAKTEM